MRRWLILLKHCFPTLDQKLFLLDLTYFNPALKQEPLLIGWPIVQHFRYLGTGVERIAEWPWQREQDTFQKEPLYARQQDMRRPLSIIVLPVESIPGP